jgi:hypothetical protein
VPRSDYYLIVLSIICYPLVDCLVAPATCGTIANCLHILFASSLPCTRLAVALPSPCRRLAVVGTLKDGYVRNIPLPRVPQIQSASPTTNRESIAPKAGIPLPGYLHVPSWIPTLPKLGSILGFSQRLLSPFSPIAIKAKNCLGGEERREQAKL